MVSVLENEYTYCIVKRQSDLLKKLIKEANAKEFIEVGCGEGHNLDLLSDMGLKGIGIDVSGGGYSIAKKENIKNVQLTTV